MERRGELGAEKVNRQFLRAAGLEMLLVDSGNKPEELCSVAALGELAGVPSYEVVRMESVAEAVARNGVAADGFADALEDALENASSGRVVGLKSIVAYRSTLLSSMSGSPMPMWNWIGKPFCRARSAPVHIKWRSSTASVIRALPVRSISASHLLAALTTSAGDGCV